MADWLAEQARRQQSQRLEEAAQSIERCRTLAGYLREAWPVIEPSNPYIHGWHIDAMADHLTAVSAGQIPRLLINVPPGTMKSLMVSVAWPSWEWGPAGTPTMRYLSTSYSDRYVARDSRRMRDLVLSEWYQARWPVRLLREGEVSFENDAKGWREGVPFKSLTGGRAHRVLVDDPHSTESAESEAERETASRIFRESLPTRLVEPATSAIIVIMQRLHVRDIAALAIEAGYVHLMLPMEFEPDRKCVVYLKDKLFFEDPRTKEGELLFPQRFPREVVDRDTRVMGSYAAAGQFQQRPTVREGGLFKRSWFKTVGAAPIGTRWVRYWDIAATEEQLGTKAAYTAGVKLGRTPSGRFIIGDVARLRAEGHGVRRLIKDTAKDDGPEVEIGYPQDPGAAGKIVAQDLTLMLAGFIARASIESGDKVQRAEPVAAQAEAGNVDILAEQPGRPWHEDFLEEATNFPGGQFKDQIDALSGAFSRLIGGGMFDRPETDLAMSAVRIQGIWPRVCALEITNTLVAATWAAFDRSAGSMVVYDTYRAPRVSMAVHAEALRKRGVWIPILFDLESRKRSKDEGLRIGEHLLSLGVELFTVPLDLESGTVAMAERISTGRLRVFETLPDWFAEYRRFRRDEKGELVDADNELIRCTALIANHGEGLAVTENKAASDARGYDPVEDARERSSTGY